MAAFDVAVGAGGAEDAPNLTTGSFSPSGSDRWIFGIVAAGGFSGTPDVTEMRYGGSGGTQLVQIGSDLTVNARHAVWGLTPGPSGSTTLFGDWATPLPQSSAVVGATFTGVDQSTPNGTAVTNSGDGETATVRLSVTVTGVVSGQVVAAGFSAFDFQANIQSFVGANGTSVRASGIGTDIGAVGACVATKVAAGTSVTLEVDVTSSAANFISWGVHAVGVNDAASASSVSESGAVADTCSAVVVHAVNVAESAGAVDSVSALAVFVSTIAETLAVTATPSAVAAMVAAVSDSTAAVDTSSGALSIPAAASESLAAADTADWGGATYAGDVAESAAATDTQSSLGVLTAATAESAAAMEQLSALLIGVAELTETSLAIDSATGLVVGSAVTAETGAAVGTTSATVGAPIVTPTWPAGGTTRLGAATLKDSPERIGGATLKDSPERIGGATLRGTPRRIG